MTARTHDAFAFASLVTVAVYFPPSGVTILTFVASLVGNIVGCLIPDMDQASNRLWDLLPAGNEVGKVLRNLFLAHRALSHSILGFAIFYWLLGRLTTLLFNPQYVNPHVVFISIMIGYVSHLLADFITREGLPLFFPFKWKFGFPPITMLRVKTGSWVETYLVLPLVGLYTVWFVAIHQSEVFTILKSVQR